MADQLVNYVISLVIRVVIGQGLAALLRRIEGILQSTRQTMSLLIPYERGDLVSILHEQAIVNREKYQAEGTYLEAYVPDNLAGLVEPYRLEPSPAQDSFYTDSKSSH